MGRKLAQTAYYINQAFGQETNKCTNIDSKNVGTQIGTLEMEDYRYPLIDNNQERSIIEVNSCKTTLEIVELNIDHSIVWHLQLIRNQKTFDNRCYVRTKIKNKIKSVIKSSLYIFWAAKEAISWLNCITVNVFYTAINVSQYQDSSETSKNFPKSKLLGIIHYNFLNPTETTTAQWYWQEINKMH